MDRNLYRFKLNIYLMYGYWFFHSLIFAYVIERLYWASKGVTNQQVVYTEIIYAGVVALLEVPTGSLADRWNKKKLIQLTALLSLGEFLILIYAQKFWHFALAVSLAGIGKSLSSGTCNALIYDSLKMLSKESSFEKISGRITFFDYTASMIAALIGSYVAYNNGNISTYRLSLISLIIAFIITLFITEPSGIMAESKTTSYIHCISEAYIFLKKRSAIRFVLLFGIITTAVFTYIDEFWQVYLNELNIPVYLFGIISSIRMISSSISGLYAYALKKYFSYNNIFSLVILVVTISIVLTGFLSSVWGLIPLILTFAIFGVVEPLVLGYLHHRTDSSIRATVESFQSLVLRLSTIICGLIFGYFSTYYSIFAGFKVLGGILTSYSVYYFLYNKKSLKADEKTIS